MSPFFLNSHHFFVFTSSHKCILTIVVKTVQGSMRGFQNQPPARSLNFPIPIVLPGTHKVSNSEYEHMMKNPPTENVTIPLVQFPQVPSNTNVVEQVSRVNHQSGPNLSGTPMTYEFQASVQFPKVSFPIFPGKAIFNLPFTV